MSTHSTNDNTTTPSLEEEAVMSLPLSKIKKIFKMDPDYAGSSASAVYATGAATELFVQYLVEQASMNAKAEKRKKIQYRDLSAAVSSQESLHFLSDTIPKTQTVEKALKEKSINVSEEDRKRCETFFNESESMADGNLKQLTRSAAEPETMKPALDKGQATLPFQSMTNPNVKKAGLLDLMAAEDEGTGETDAMIVD